MRLSARKPINHIKSSLGSRIFDAWNLLFLLFLSAFTLYPFLFTAFASLSDARKLLIFDGVLLAPLQPMTIDGYKQTLSDPKIAAGFANTIFYVVAGTSINMLLTIFGAYVSINKNFVLRKFMMKAILVTMFFGGGMIPSYLVVRNLGLINNRFAVILPGAIGTYNLIVLRTFFQSIPPSLEESAFLDGANDMQVLFRIILPLSMPALAVIMLYYIVGHWNEWFSAMIYLQDRSKYPLQIFLRERLITEEAAVDKVNAAAMSAEAYTRELVKYCTIMVTTVPVLIAYPFLQKYFVKGVMIGAVKG